MLRAKPQRHRDTGKAQSQPPTSQPRRHEDTKTSQSLLDSPARSRPPGGRGPLGAGAASDASTRSCTHSQRPALSESAGLASRVDQRSTFEQARLRRDRRAASASAGGKSDRDGCLHPERSGFSPGAGESRRCRRSTPGNLANAGFAPLCPSCLRGCDDSWLCVSVSLWLVRYLGSSKTLQPRT
jgi:hypothetical protein